MPDFLFPILLLVTAGAPVALAGGSTTFAALTAPPGRHGRTRSIHLASGAIVAGFGLGVMALIAWSTREDGHYDDFGSAMTFLAGIVAATVFALGLGPFVPWLLGVLGRRGAGPVAVRLAARHLADRRGRTAPAVAGTMVATALAVATAMLAGAAGAQSRAAFVPQSQLGALVVTFPAEHEAPALAAIQRELPGVTPVQGLQPIWPADVMASAYGWSGGRLYIGDATLLRYLTGNPAFPYDESKIVHVTSEDDGDDEVEITYRADPRNPSVEPTAVKATPTTVVEPAAQGVEAVFVPAVILRDMGVPLETVALIVDPAAYRASEAERDRVQARLGDKGEAYLETGFEPVTGWLYFAGGAALLALGCALAATVRSDHAGRVLRRVGGSPFAARLLTACRAALAAACGAVPGAVAGYVIGLLLSWPHTTSSDWEAPARVPFDVPWGPILLLVAALPVLAAGSALLLPAKGRFVRRAPVP